MIVIVMLDTLTIPYKYDADVPDQSAYGGEWGSPSASVHLPVPDGLSWDTVMAVRDSEGQITLIEDPEKVAKKHQAQIESNRAQRNSLLQASDFAVLSDVDLANKPDWIQYRAALRAVDLSEPVWPQVPQVVWEAQ